jgi:hypothetical protein
MFGSVGMHQEFIHFNPNFLPLHCTLQRAVHPSCKGSHRILADFSQRKELKALRV